MIRIKIMPLAFLGVLALTGVAMPLDYPTKPIQVIVPYPPGGGNDIVTRIMASKLSSILEQPVIVVNKTGGGGAAGIKFASTARPDGYTILCSSPGLVMIPVINPGVGFKLEDFAPISLAVSFPQALTVKADAPWKNLEELIKDAKRNPGKLTYSTAGPGTTGHFAGELFKLETGINTVHVPMGGEGPAITGILGGHVDMAVTGLGPVSSYLRAGTLKSLGFLSPKRLKDFPNVPTIKELGYPNVIAISWTGYFFPAKTPKEMVDKVAKAFEITLKDEEIIKNLEKLGDVVENLMPEEADKFFRAEEKKWKEVGVRANMVERSGK
jgi:tripartite-type tricarboxylate transporter receptor subunit TctC